MDLTAFVNPEAFHELPCHWNMQLADSCRPHLCKTTWNHGTDDPETPVPLVMHASGAGKQYGKWLAEKPTELAKDCEIPYTVYSYNSCSRRLSTALSIRKTNKSIHHV